MCSEESTPEFDLPILFILTNLFFMRAAWCKDRQSILTYIVSNNEFVCRLVKKEIKIVTQYISKKIRFKNMQVAFL